MTITAHIPVQQAPHFPACPTWCDQYDAHDLYGEVARHNGDPLLTERVHEVELWAGPVRTYPHIGTGRASITLTRTDWGSWGDGSEESDLPTLTILLADRDGTAVTVAADRRDLDTARGIADAILRAIQLLESS